MALVKMKELAMTHIVNVWLDNKWLSPTQHSEECLKYQHFSSLQHIKNFIENNDSVEFINEVQQFVAGYTDIPANMIAMFNYCHQELMFQILEEEMAIILQKMEEIEEESEESEYESDESEEERKQ